MFKGAMDKTVLHQDPLFRKIVVGSTGLGLACMLSSVAAIRIGQGTGLEFGWHWSILGVAAVVVLWNRKFWNVVWELQCAPSVATKRKLGRHLVILLVLGVGCFLYPIRFIEQSYIGGIIRGLATAGAFLGTMAWLIFQCGRGLTQIDEVELDRQARTRAE
jgi:hypothetical protein